jgi:hypothetical protein
MAWAPPLLSIDSTRSELTLFGRLRHERGARETLLRFCGAGRRTIGPIHKTSKSWRRADKLMKLTERSGTHHFPIWVVRYRPPYGYQILRASSTRVARRSPCTDRPVTTTVIRADRSLERSLCRPNLLRPCLRRRNTPLPATTVVDSARHARDR